VETDTDDSPGSAIVTSDAAADEVEDALSISEASRATGVTRSALQRSIQAQAFPGAYREDTVRGAAAGPWKIPVGDLIAAGYTLDTEIDPEVRRLRVELAHERQRRVAAERLVQELATALENTNIEVRATPEKVTSSIAGRNAGPPIRRMRGNWLR